MSESVTTVPPPVDPPEEIASGPWDLVKVAYMARAWTALGYSTWDDYCANEFGNVRSRLPVAERRKVVNFLRGPGHSAYGLAIAVGLGIGDSGRCSPEQARGLSDRIKAAFVAVNRLREQKPAQAKAERLDARDVYFMQAESGLIKIGVAADPRARLRTLAFMSPVRLTLLGTIPGLGATGESELHRRFATARSHGEWFHATPGLLSYIREIS